MTEVTIGIAVGIALAVLGGMWAWVRWSAGTRLEEIVSVAITETVNGRLDRIDRSLGEVQHCLGEMEGWNASHDRRHAYEQTQLLAALARQGVDPPDGWDVP